MDVLRSILCLSILLLVSGDVEQNPGPPRRVPGSGKTGPSAEEKLDSVNATLEQYEDKMKEMKKDMESHNKEANKRLEGIESKLEVLLSDLTSVKGGEGEIFSEIKSSIQDKNEAVEKEIEEMKTTLASLVETQHSVKEDTSTTAQRLAATEEEISQLRLRSDGGIHGVLQESRDLHDKYSYVEQKVKELKLETSGKIQSVGSQQKEQRREYKAKLLDVEVELQRLRERVQNVNAAVEDLHEKFYEFEQSKRNNLILYGLRDRPHENQESLKSHILSLLRDNLNIRREIPVIKATRVFTGPEVRGCRPVLVTFESFKDRETVLRQAKLLKKKAGIDVSEDLSRRTRESRSELRKFLRKIKRSNPERNCFLEYDKLYVDHKVYVYSDTLGQVVEMSELQRYADPAFSLMLSRPGTRMGASGGNYFGAEFNSRPPSGMGGATNRHAERIAATKSASGIPRLPPLDRSMSLSTGALRQNADPYNDKVDEMERMVASYEEKLSNVTSNYQEKVNILENRLVERDLNKDDGEIANGNGHHHMNGNESESDAEPNSPVHPIRQESPPMNIIMAGSNNIHSIPEEEFTKEENEKDHEDEDGGRNSPNKIMQQEVA